MASNKLPPLNLYYNNQKSNRASEGGATKFWFSIALMGTHVTLESLKLQERRKTPSWSLILSNLSLEYWTTSILLTKTMIWSTPKLLISCTCSHVWPPALLQHLLVLPLISCLGQNLYALVNPTPQHGNLAS